MKSKFKLIDSLLKELNGSNENLNIDFDFEPIEKRSQPKVRSMKNSERKRPGWELAYGRRRRSTN